MTPMLRCLVVSTLALLAIPTLAAPSVGDPAPALTVTAFDHGTVDLASLRGQVVLVNFWATWCVPCREEMPALNAAYDKLHDKGVVMLGLSADRARDRPAAVKMAASQHYPAALLSEATSDGFGAPVALPVSYLIDGKGVVRTVLTPTTTALTEAQIEQAITALLPTK